jgi:uncharacterized repeat protein (TIGR01451 family)
MQSGIKVGAKILVFLSVAASAVALPPAVQTYYLPLPETHTYQLFETINSATTTNIRNVISIAPNATNTLIVFDHFEDGYEANMALPTQATTRIWGDNNPTNGIPPGFATDLISAGKIITLQSVVTVPHNPATIIYDGQDRFTSTKAVAVTFSAWPISPGAVLAEAVEVYDTTSWGTNFIAPVGTNVAASSSFFQYTAFSIMAGDDSTVVRVDRNADGIFELSNTLSRGSAWLVETGIVAGAQVRSSKLVQTILLTGDINSTYETRWFMLTPVEDWCFCGVVPVTTTSAGDPVNVFLYNQYTHSITVDVTLVSSTTSFVVGPRSTYRYAMPAGSGAQMLIRGQNPAAPTKFYSAVGIVDASDTGNADFDWGFTVPTLRGLTSQALVGWGPGADTNSPAWTGTQNGSPVWVVALSNTTIYADFDANPSTGPLVDPNGNRYNFRTNVSAFQSVRIFDTTDRDQTGMRIYTLNKTPISVAWGEDPSNATADNPYLDMGTTVPALSTFSGGKSYSLVGGDGDSLAEPGETLEYSLTLANEGLLPVENVSLVDPLPAYVSYVPNSTKLNGAAVADDVSGTPFPLDAAGLTNIPNVAAFSNLTVVFRVAITNPFPQNVSTLVNAGTFFTLDGEVSVGVETPVVQADLALTKSVNRTFVLPGSNFVYTVTATNKGPNVATGVTVRDLLPAGLIFVSGGAGVYSSSNGIWTIGTLNVNAGTTLQFTVRASVAGVYTNMAQVWAANVFDPNSTPSNNVPSEDDQASVVITAVAPGVTLVKTSGSTADGAIQYVTAGQPVVYSFRVVNSGNTHLTGLVVTDNKLGAVGVIPGPLAPGASVTLYATNAGVLASVTNIGSVVGTPSQANGTPLAGIATVSATDNAVVLLVRPEIHMHKAATAPETGPVHLPDGHVHYTTYGSNVLYMYHLHNYGDTALTNVTVTDDKLGFIGIVPFLATNQAAYLFATNFNFTNYVLNVGTVTGTPAFASGAPIPGLAPVTHSDTAVADVAFPGVRVIKTAGAANDGDPLYVLAGSNVVYSYAITVTGDTGLTNVTVTDDKLGFVGVLPGPLLPGSTHYLYATRSNVTASVTNMAFVTGYPTNGLPPVTDDHPAVVKVVRPGVLLVKTAGAAPDGGTNYVTAGSSVIYTYRVINTGDTHLTNIVVTDDRLGFVGALAGPLAPGATNTLTKTATNVTASVVNLGTVRAGPSDANADPLPGIPAVSDTDPASVQVVRPGVLLVKTAGSAPDGGTNYVTRGSSAVYTYRVTNTGDTWLVNLAVTDDRLGAIGTIPGPLAPGASASLLATNLNVLASVVNLGTVTATPAFPGGAAIPGLGAVSDTDPAFVQVVRPGLDLVKTANAAPDGQPLYVTAGSAVVYTFRVTNTGDTWLASISVTDDKLGAVGTIPGPLAPGASASLFRTNLSVLASVTNIGTASGLPVQATGASLGLPAVVDTDPAVALLVAPSVTLVKTAGIAPDGGIHYVVANTPVVYAYRVVNSGSTHLTGITVTDDKLGPVGVIPGPLAPGATNYLYDTNVGIVASVTNIGTVTATPSSAGGQPLGVASVQDTDDAVVQLVRPEIHMHKAATAPETGPVHVPDGSVHYTTPGSNVLYVYHMHNYGDTALTNITVTDDKLGFIGVIPFLATNRAGYLFATNFNFTNYVLNVGTVTGTPAFASGAPIPGLAPVTHSDTAVADVSVPGVRVIKTAGNAKDGDVLFVLPGSNVVYTYEITVTGDAGLTNVIVTDDKLGLVGVLPGPLLPGSTNYLYATNLNVRGNITNIVVVTGYPTNGLPPVQDDHPAVVQVVSPGVSIVKTAGATPDGGTNFTLSGASVLYTYRVFNTGDTYLTNLVVTDDKLGLVGVIVGPLAPGANAVLTKTAAVVTADVVNVGTVVAGPSDANGDKLPGIPDVTDNDAAVVVVANPAFGLSKTLVSPSGRPLLPGDTAEFLITVTNRGDVTLVTVPVEDRYNVLELAVASASPAPDSPANDGVLNWANVGPLAPGQSVSLSLAFTVVGSTAGRSSTNVAVASPTVPPGYPGVPPQTNGAVYSVVVPGIGIVKTAGDAAEGEVYYTRSGADVTYTFVVTNTGDVFLTNVVVTDDVLGPIGVIPGPVAPGWSATLTAVHSNVVMDVRNVALARGTPAASDGSPLPQLPDVAASNDALARITFLLLQKEDNPDPVRAGATLTYTLWVANPSPNTVTGVVVTEQYPALFAFVGALPAPSAGNNVWSLGSLEPGDMVPIVISGTVNAGAPDGTVLTNRVTVESANADTLRTNETTRVVGPTPRGSAEIRVTKRDDADPVAPGGALAYTIRVENFGPVTASNVVVTETYDPLFRFVSAAPAPKAGTDNVWQLGNLPTNTFVEIVVSGLVSTSAPNGYLVFDVVTARARNAAPSSDSEVTLVGVRPPPQVTKTASVDPAQGGKMLIYTVTVANVSQELIEEVRVVESYDPNFIFQSSVPATRFGTDNVWDLGDLPPGYVTNIVIEGLVSGKALERDVLFNTVEVISRSGSRTVHLVTRVINPKVIPVTLLYFKAVDAPGRVKLKWKTATEFENLGFNLYRSTKLAGYRTRLNAQLVPGSETTAGQEYRFFDETARPGATYYYWLEEVSWNYKCKVYGPAVRAGSGVAGRAAPLNVLAAFRTSETGGLYRIRYETLEAAGLPVKTLDPKTLAVRVGGVSVPAYVSSQGQYMGADDFILFYAPKSLKGLACQVTVNEPGAVMEVVPAAPTHAAGQVFGAAAGLDQKIRFKTDPEVARYFLHGFYDTPVWVLDVTVPTNAVMLYGYAYVMLTNGESAVYLSYAPDAPARCLAVQDAMVMDVTRVRGAE